MQCYVKKKSTLEVDDHLCQQDTRFDLAMVDIFLRLLDFGSFSTRRVYYTNPLPLSGGDFCSISAEL